MDIRSEVLKRVKPNEDNIKNMNKVASELVQRVNKSAAKMGPNAHAMLVGSAARGTWIRSERDIDIFVLFPEVLSREELEQQGMAIARDVAGSTGKERFAEHPYVTMRFKEFDVDLVPCYDLKDTRKIKSAVDRTPHHQKYVEGRLTPQLAEEVLLLKQFAYGAGVYGAELKTQGFSGYLCELLILHYGSFEKLVYGASGWGLGKIIDIGKRYRDESESQVLFERQQLLVIDPVDPTRNVAAAVSLQNFTIFVRACQDYNKRASLNFFFPNKVIPLGPSELDRTLKTRNTRLFCLTFRSPDVVPDVLYPQLRKTEKTLTTRLAQLGFEVLRSDVWANSNAVIILELRVSKLPRVRTRVGPPLRMTVDRFILEHINSPDKLAGPFVDPVGRIVFELKRKQTSALDVLKDVLTERTAFGKNVAEAVGVGYEIIEGIKIKKLLRYPGFSEFISDYLTRCLPWYR